MPVKRRSSDIESCSKRYYVHYGFKKNESNSDSPVQLYNYIPVQVESSALKRLFIAGTYLAHSDKCIRGMLNASIFQSKVSNTLQWARQQKRNAI